MSVNPPKTGPSVIAVLVIASVVLATLAGVIIALTLTLVNSAPRSDRDEAADDESESSEIVLDATWADGSSLDDDEVGLATDIITSRLEDIGVAPSDISFDDDQFLITLDDDTDEDTLDEAAHVLDVTFSADFRPVLDSFLCSSGGDYTDYGPDKESTLCDQEGLEALDLGPSEVSGETIIGASTYEQKTGEYWGVSMVFNPDGAADLAELTSRLVGAEEGKNRLAIVLGGEVLSSPEVTEAIMNGEVSINGSFDEADAEALAAQLRFAAKGLVLSVDSATLAD